MNALIVIRINNNRAQSFLSDMPTVHLWCMPTSQHPPVRDDYAAYTNQGFLGRETSETAHLLGDGVSEQDVRRRATDENLFQLTSESSRRSTVNAVLARLDGASGQLLDVLASSDPDTRRQATLYVILLQHRLLREFIADVIVPKARLADDVVTETDVAVFMQRVASQQPDVHAWSTSTKQKAVSNMLRVLTDAGLLERKARDRHVIRTSWVSPELRNELDAAGRASYLTLLLDQGGAA
ncbi:MAG: DUF1819 family protein [Trueperaceae bacterium]|nr:DUF1819 family protein [Trueperaceae bacterium]